MRPMKPLALNTLLRWILAGGAGASLLLAGCNGSDGDPGPPGAPGETPPTDTTLSPGENPPGVNLEILGVAGASGAGGNFLPGDHVRVTYRLTKDDGSVWDVHEMVRDRILISGPTHTYQRVIPVQSDLAEGSVKNPDGTYTYTFAIPLPSVYAAPYNDTPSFGSGDGELTGQPLQGGTYTVGMYVRWDYSIEGTTYRDADDATFDFLVGGATAVRPRAVVSQQNCNRCHDDLRAHGQDRKSVTLCLLCHTAGAEDRNVATVAGGTPGASIEFSVMIHKIHSGRHLPSVQGVTTGPGGSRVYGSAVPYQLVGFGDSVHDYSDVGFPDFPSALYPMPRDFGFSSLSGSAQEAEDAIRSGVVDCAACHGDPDGAGPIEAPEDGALAYAQPSRRACGSCHDDVVWNQVYSSNGQTMPPMLDDATCKDCHAVSGDPLAVEDAHRHPLLDPTVDPGLAVEVLGVNETGASDGDGTLDPGENVQLTFTLRDASGQDVDPATVDALYVGIAGPSENMTLVHYVQLPTDALSGPQPFSLKVPRKVDLEFVGTSDAGTLGETFDTAFAPHWTAASTPTAVYTHPAPSTSTTLTAAATAPTNYLDVADGSGFARDDVVVIDSGDPAKTEYHVVRWVDGNRIWLSSPYELVDPAGTVYDHSSGANVELVTLTQLTEGVDYTLDPAQGRIAELVEFGAGPVIVSYTTDLVWPSDYPLSLNDGPSIDESYGEWAGKPIVPGTYRLSLWGYRSFTLTLHGETNSYRASAPASSVDFLVGDALSLEPYALIEDESTCERCHQELWFHGATRRGYDSCVVCHGAIGAEDRPRYVAANAPETSAASVGFRQLLHKVHMGEALAGAASYQVVGFGLPSLYPDNYSVHTYEDVAFPALPGGAQNCAVCHGNSQAWQHPASLDHPTAATQPSRPWRTVCGACHDSTESAAHIELQTTAGGLESCGVCHGVGSALSVENVHRPR